MICLQELSYNVYKLNCSSHPPLYCFELSVGAVGPAIYAFELSDPVGLTDVDMVNNIVAPLDGSPIQLLLDSSGAVHIHSMFLVLTGQCKIKEHVTGVHGWESAIVISPISYINVASSTGAFWRGNDSFVLDIDLHHFLRPRYR